MSFRQSLLSLKNYTLYQYISNIDDDSFAELRPLCYTKYISNFKLTHILQISVWGTYRYKSYFPCSPSFLKSLCFVFSCTKALSSMDLLTSPHDKLDCISKFCKSLYVSLTKSASLSDKAESISADDLLPAVVYIVLKSRVHNIYFHLKYVEYWIGNTNILETGQTGYEFTTIVSFLRIILRIFQRLI